MARGAGGGVVGANGGVGWKNGSAGGGKLPAEGPAGAAVAPPGGGSSWLSTRDVTTGGAEGNSGCCAAAGPSGREPMDCPVNLSAFAQALKARASPKTDIARQSDARDALR